MEANLEGQRIEEKENQEAIEKNTEEENTQREELDSFRYPWIESILEQKEWVENYKLVWKQLNNIENKYGEEAVELAKVLLETISTKEGFKHIEDFFDVFDERGRLQPLLEEEPGKVKTFVEEWFNRYIEKNDINLGDQREDTEDQREDTEETLEQEEVEEERTEEQRERKETLESWIIEELKEQSWEIAERFGMDSEEIEQEAEQRQEAIQQAAADNWKEITQEQAYAVAYSGVVAEKVPAEHQNDPEVQEFLWNYNQGAASLWC